MAVAVTVERAVAVEVAVLVWRAMAMAVAVMPAVVPALV